MDICICHFFAKSDMILYDKSKNYKCPVPFFFKSSCPQRLVSFPTDFVRVERLRPTFVDNVLPSPLFWIHLLMYISLWLWYFSFTYKRKRTNVIFSKMWHFCILMLIISGSLRTKLDNMRTIRCHWIRPR